MSEPLIKVLSVCTSDSSGGAARAAYRIHRAIKDIGVDSQMFVKQKGTDDPTVLTVDEFIPKNVLYKGYDWIRNKVKNKWQHYLWRKYPDREHYFMSDLRSTDINGALRKIDYDILHLHWVNLRFLPLEQLPKDKPIVWTLHDSWPFCGICHYFFECERYQDQCGRCPMLSSKGERDLSHQIWLEKHHLYSSLDLKIVTPSRWLSDCAGRSSLFSRFPVQTIPNCINTEAFSPVSNEQLSLRWNCFKEKSFEKPFLLYGAMNAAKDKRKGFTNLLESLQILEKTGHGNEFELIVFGTDKPLEGIPPRIPIHYVGYVNDEKELASLYSIAQVMIVPSLNENLSCVIMESLSCGTPVVAFNIGGNPDMIDHRVNGYLAREQDNEDLAAGILWCLDHNKDGSLSKNARQKVLDNYSPIIIGKKYLYLYNECINPIV